MYSVFLLIQFSCTQKESDFITSINIDVIKSNYIIGLDFLSKENFEELILIYFRN